MPRNARPHRNAEADFRGEKRSKATHASTTDPDARLYKKSPGTGAMLCFTGHALMENRNGVVVQGDLTRADGYAERRRRLERSSRYCATVVIELRLPSRRVWLPRQRIKWVPGLQKLGKMGEAISRPAPYRADLLLGPLTNASGMGNCLGVPDTMLKLGARGAT